MNVHLIHLDSLMGMASLKPLVVEMRESFRIVEHDLYWMSQPMWLAYALTFIRFVLGRLGTSQRET
jgi:hypothetical protein